MEQWTLQEIEQRIQEHLQSLAVSQAEGFERPSREAWLECYTAFAQVRQAIALEAIVKQMKVGIVVEQA